MNTGTFCRKRKYSELVSAEYANKETSKKLQCKKLICIPTFTKYPPANMKVITVTEASVVAFFKSINVAPIANPSPCDVISRFSKAEKNSLLLYNISIGRKGEAYLCCNYAEENYQHGEEKCFRTMFQACHEIDYAKEK